MNADDGPVERSWHDRPFSRRGFLAGVAGLSAGAMVARAPTVALAADTAGGLHGVPLRGMYLTQKDRLAEGRFGAMFKRLPAFAPRDDLLDGLPEFFEAGRYHALAAAEPASDAALEVSARLADGSGLIMGLRHRTLPIEGVQFHPESVLTPLGFEILANFARQTGLQPHPPAQAALSRAR